MAACVEDTSPNDAQLIIAVDQCVDFGDPSGPDVWKHFKHLLMYSLFTGCHLEEGNTNTRDKIRVCISQFLRDVCITLEGRVDDQFIEGLRTALTGSCTPVPPQVLETMLAGMGAFNVHSMRAIWQCDAACAHILDFLAGAVTAARLVLQKTPPTHTQWVALVRDMLLAWSDGATTAISGTSTVEKRSYLHLFTEKLEESLQTEKTRVQALQNDITELWKELRQSQELLRQAQEQHRQAQEQAMNDPLCVLGYCSGEEDKDAALESMQLQIDTLLHESEYYRKRCEEFQKAATKAPQPLPSPEGSSRSSNKRQRRRRSRSPCRQDIDRHVRRHDRRESRTRMSGGRKAWYY
jgi:hypothetical protein